MSQDKIALLDTDFINKMYISKKDDADRMIDRVLSFPDYKFVCHSQIKVELDRHGESALCWLQIKEADGFIKVYTDYDILTMLYEVYGQLGCSVYFNMLEQSCRIFSGSLFATYYEPAYVLSQTEHADIMAVSTKILDCDAAVGPDNNLGEIKTYVLAQAIERLSLGSTFLFCSDDKKARRALSVAPDCSSMECISATAVFLLAKEWLNIEEKDIVPYYTSWMDFHSKTNQTCFRVYDKTNSKIYKVDGWQLLNDIYDDKFSLRVDGYLFYK